MDSLGALLIRSDAMRIEAWGVPALAFVVGMVVAGEANGKGGQRKSDLEPTVPVVAVRGETARDEVAREAAVRRALAQAAAAVEARRPVVAKQSGGEGKPQPVELTLMGPAGGVRLSVRDRLPSGFVYRRLGGESSGTASCGGAVFPVAALDDAEPSVDSNEVRP